MSDHYPRSADAERGCGMLFVATPVGAALWALILLGLGQLLRVPPLVTIAWLFLLVAIVLLGLVLAIFISAVRDTAAARDARRRNGSRS